MKSAASIVLPYRAELPALEAPGPAPIVSIFDVLRESELGSRQFRLAAV